MSDQLSLQQWVINNISHDYIESQRIVMEESPNDPETEPYKSLYASREHLSAVLARLNGCPSQLKQGEDYTSLCAFVQYRLGLNYINTDELFSGQESFENVIELSKCVDSLFKICFPLVASLNELAILCSHTDDETALKLLLKAKSVFEACKSQPTPLTDKDWFPSELHTTILKEKSFEDIHTHTLYYLAQVYSNLDDKKLSAVYCQITLSRQLNNKLYDPVEWSLNAANMSQYYMQTNNYAQSRHCLASAQVILKQYITESEPIDDPALKEKLQRSEADVSRCWIKYCISLLKSSKKVLDKEGDSDVNKDALHRFEPLLVSEIEGEVLCVLAEDYQGARSIFLFAQKHVQKAKSFFTFDNCVLDYVAIAQDYSQLFKLLAAFETDLSLKCRMHKRRIDMLSSLLSISRNHYLVLIGQLHYEIGGIYESMVDLKILLANNEDGPPTPHSLNKINMLVQSAINNFQKFVEIFNEPIDDIHTYLTARLHIAQLYSKFIGTSLEERTQYIHSSLNVYKWILNYRDNHKDVESVFAEEIKLCEEMVELLPLKLTLIK